MMHKAPTTNHKGFTYIELTIVLAIIVILGTLTVSFGVPFYRTQIMDETFYDLRSSFRHASLQAQTGKNDSSFGVKLLSDQFVSRDASEDVVYNIPNAIQITGFDEIVFAPVTGFPSISATVVLQLNGDPMPARTIIIATNSIIE
jgi:prepilin-type N-terminal cleavage/methylation domain-containing protein